MPIAIMFMLTTLLRQLLKISGCLPGRFKSSLDNMIILIPNPSLRLISLNKNYKQYANSN